MKKKIIVGVLVIGLLLCVTVMTFAQSKSNVRWEYTYVRGSNLDQIIIDSDKLGAEGWELVTSNIGGSGNHTLFFKRILP